MKPVDTQGALQDAAENCKWLHDRVMDGQLASAADWDVKDAVKIADELNQIVRVIRTIDQNHVRNAFAVSRRSL
jgi:hypothetical protein